MTSDQFSSSTGAAGQPHDLTRSPILPDVARLSPEEAHSLEQSGARWKETVVPAGAEEAARADPMPRERVLRARGGFYLRLGKLDEFEGIGPNTLRARREASQSPSAAGQLLDDLKRVLVGDALSLQAYTHERLTKVKALAVLSSDAISSVAYATEQILLVLVAAGAAAIWLSLPIAAAIIALMIIVGVSYRQTILAYPKGGGSYIVAKDNLGPVPGLTAAAALMTDYTLTVAVSVASGVSAMIAAYPVLSDWRVPLGVACIVFIFLGNLRGIREAGSIFSIPTYAFIVGMIALIVVGFVRLFTGTAAVAPPVTSPATEGLTIFLVLRAFSSGCSAMTGVEAISDGVPAFQAPEWKNARTTLTVMIAILASIFGGVTLLAHFYNLVGDPTGNNPLISQLNASVFGNGPVFYSIQFATFLILVLAANTSFSDFPRLLFFLARDDYAPRIFRRVGDRLAFSNGIIALAVLAAILYVVFGGQVDNLIPLYTIGVFASFTLSQAGMVKRWYSRREAGEAHGIAWTAESGWRRRAAMNGLGAITTFVVLTIAAISKFTEGAWFVIVLIPAIVMVFLMINRHYTTASRDLRLDDPYAPQDFHHQIICPISDLNRPALRALAYARSLSPHVVAVHVSQDDDDQQLMHTKWQLWGAYLPLEIIESPYRGVVLPLVTYIKRLRERRPNDTITVVLPEYVPTHLWDNALHNQTALRLKRHLLGFPGVVVINVPYHQRRPETLPGRPERAVPPT